MRTRRFLITAALSATAAMVFWTAGGPGETAGPRGSGERALRPGPTVTSAGRPVADARKTDDLRGLNRLMGLNRFQRDMVQRLAARRDDQAGARPAICFAPGTPPEVVEAFTQFQGQPEPEVSPFQFDELYRWFATALSGAGLGQGDPTILT